MRRVLLALLIGALGNMAMAQQPTGTFASISGADRLEVIKSSIDVPSWHEKSFWPLYDKYMTRMQEASSMANRALNDLATLQEPNNQHEAYDFGRKLLDFRIAELNVIKQYYGEIGAQFNGIIALQFIQTEALLNMMESSNIYEQTSWKKYRFHKKGQTSAQFRSAKYNTIAKAIKLSPEQASTFFRVYSLYEEECDNVLGKDYDLIGYYAGEAADYTPGLAKRMGNDLINVMQRELKLKDKYFERMNKEVGCVLASKFLAWEDYYSLVSKMHAWSEGL